ncbi:MAG: hypothetical protein ABRQ24_10830 [Syntrophomonadaceae bacterium]
MRSNSESIKKLKNEIAVVSKEIDYRIDRLDKLPNEMDNNCKALKTFVDNRYDELEAQFRQAYMVRGEDVWEFAWDNIGEIVEEFQHKAAQGKKCTFPGLEPALRSRRTVLGRKLKLNALWADQVWTEVWTGVAQAVQHVSDEYRHEAMAEFERCAEELNPLLDKKATLKKELEGMQSAEEGVYKALKSAFGNKGKGRP